MSSTTDNVAIRVDNLSKTFKIPLEGSNGLKQKLVNVLKGRRGYRKFYSLKDVSFEIKKGEFFGIVGKNGSGKSTLLKTIAEIYHPTTGSVSVNGSLIPFIELGVGFNPELTGRENIFLNGALLGFSRKEMEGMYGDIVGFAELHDFIEERLKNYSSGMQVRLAFSIAIRAKSDILLLDEILAVGDEAFQRKCLNYFYSIKKSGQTVILVTHDMANVEKFCDRALVLNDGHVLGIYKPAKAKLVYEQLNRNAATRREGIELEKRWGNGEARFESIKIKDSTKSLTVTQGGPLVIEVLFTSKTPKDVVVGLAILDESGLVLAGPNSAEYPLNTSSKIEFSIPVVSLNPGHYSLRAALFGEDHRTEYDHIEDAVEFDVVSSTGTQHGKINLFGEWRQL